jgi:AcrR family transcriptional regulator
MAGRRSQGERAEAVRERIIDAAQEVIRAHPVADVQLAAIAERAGMRPGHVLYYFASRDDVLVETVRRAEGRNAEERAATLAGLDDPMERLERYVVDYLPDDRHDPVWKLWFEGWLRSAAHEAFARIGTEMDARWRADLVAALRAAVAAGATLDQDVEQYAKRLNVLLDGLALHVMSDHLAAGEAAAIAIDELRRDLR